MTVGIPLSLLSNLYQNCVVRQVVLRYSSTQRTTTKRVRHPVNHSLSLLTAVTVETRQTRRRHRHLATSTSTTNTKARFVDMIRGNN